MTDNTNGNNGEEANTTNPSDGAPLRVSGHKKATEQPVLGAIKSFKGLVYNKYNTKDQQVDMYNCTTKRLVDYVTVEC
jgi:hypothetical protein